MFSGNEYLNAWLFYIAGALLVAGVWWFLTRNIRHFELRYFLRLLLGVLLFVPWYTAENSPYLSPAWLMAAFEGIFEGNFWRAGLPLVIALGAVAALSLTYWLGRSFIQTRAS